MANCVRALCDPDVSSWEEEWYIYACYKLSKRDFREASDHYIVEKGRPLARFCHIYYHGLQWVIRETDLWGNLCSIQTIVHNSVR